MERALEQIVKTLDTRKTDIEFNIINDAVDSIPFQEQKLRGQKKGNPFDQYHHFA